MHTAPSDGQPTWAQADQLDMSQGGQPTTEPSGWLHRSGTAMERLLCEACGDVIGVYEPLVMRTSDSERATSRAAEPELRARDGAYFHRQCRDASAE
jgi:hypothetical protein